MIDNTALLSELYSIQESYSIEPAAIDQTDKRCIIDVKERTINIPVEIESLGVQYDHRSYKLLFEIDRYIHGVDLLTQTCVIQWLSKNGTTEHSGLHPVVEIEAIDNDKLLFVWELYEDETRIPGTILFAVNFYTMKDENSFLWSYNTLPASSTIQDTLDVVINPSDEITPSLLMVWNDKMASIERLAHDSVSTSSRSAHEAEAWAHGRTDFPNTMLDNAKYYKDLTQALYDEAKDAISEEKDRVVEEAKIEIVNLAKDEVIAVVKNEVTDDVINDVYAAKNDSITAINDTTTSAIQEVEQSKNSAINDLLATGDQRYAVKGSIPTKVSELENDSKYLTEVPEAPVKSVNGKTGDVNLSAEDVGAVASEEFTEFKVDYDNHTHTAEDVGAATRNEVSLLRSELKSDLAKKQPVGDYALRSELPTVPVQSVNGKTGAVVLNANDVGATTKSYVDSEITDLKTQGVQQTPLFPEVNDTVENAKAWLETNGDTSKVYVLPDGYIYAYMLTKTEGSVEPNFTNLMDDANSYIKDGYRYSHSSSAFKEYEGGTSIIFPYKANSGTHEFRIRGGVLSAYSTSSIYVGTDNQLFSMVLSVTSTIDDNGDIVLTSSIAEGMNGYATVTLDSVENLNDIIVTMDEEITYTITEGGTKYAWNNTGHAFVPADYENRINELEKQVEEIENTLPELVQNDYIGNILRGKKWVACGDSYTYGGYSSSDGFDESVYKYQDGKFVGKNIVYPYIIGLRNDMDIVNLASGGQTMAISTNSFMTRYTNIDADADYITIMLGINDKGQNISVGTLEDATNTTFCGAFNIAMEHILTNHPFAHIGIIVSNDTNEEYMEATRGIAERWGVPYLDLGSPHAPLMNGYTGRNVCSKAKEIRWQNFCVSPTSNGHPNTSAHEYESTFIEAWLRTL